MSSASKIASGYYNYKGYQISKIPSGERNAGMWLITPPDSYDPSDIVFSLKEGKDLIDKFDAEGYYKGGSVGGIGQFSELGHPNALPSFVDAPTPEEEIESAIRSGTASDEEFFALAKAKQSKSPIARQFHMDRANRIRMGIV
tara:strand:- start:2803 stop:3231 length:429 start_codon:yes stop_codon:yes gene_type:complete